MHEAVILCVSIHKDYEQTAGMTVEYRIENKEQLISLWSDIYNNDEHPDWSRMLPYYDEQIFFKDTIQELHGKENFIEMTQRLSKRSENLKMVIVRAAQHDDIYFLEWEMTLSFKKYPDSTLYGCSRVTVNNEGKIIEQRDYYDLWGDIFDNIPRFNKMYRKFVKKKFG
jgi:predicted SnoaL-like aldol condensation-catalyzing enzyme